MNLWREREKSTVSGPTLRSRAKTSHHWKDRGTIVIYRGFSIAKQNIKAFTPSFGQKFSGMIEGDIGS